MDLLTIKKSTGKSWAALAAETGVPEGNLHKIAQGKRGWDVETGFKLKRIGVSLDEQIEVIAEKRGWKPPPDETACPAAN